MKMRELSMVGVLGAAGLLIYALGPAGTTEGSTEENPRLVQVVNDPGTPVPTTIVGGTAVSGTVGAAQSGPWNVGASQNGAWSVAVSNLPAVQAVQFATPEMASDRMRYVIDTLTEDAALFVPDGTILTDLVATPKHFGDFLCRLEIYDGAVSLETRMFDVIPTTHAVFDLHLQNGLRGPLTILVSPSGLEPGSCSGEVFWTGYRLP